MSSSTRVVSCRTIFCERSVSTWKPNTVRHDPAVMNAIFRVTCLLLLTGTSCAVAGTAPPIHQPDETSVRQALTALRTLDYERSARQLKAAADAGNARARCLLAMMYLNGVGVT